MSSPTFDVLLGTLVSHSHGSSGAAETLQDTRENIIAASAATVRFGIAIDTLELLFADGTNWNLLPFKFYIEPPAPDMGAYQDSSRIGYYEDWITDKTLSNVSFGNNANTTTGGVRWNEDESKFQVYYGGQWNNAVVGFTFREASDGRLQLKPAGFAEWYDVFTGNSTSVGLNNLPITQQHNTHMGAYPAPQIVDGGDVNMDNPTTAYANQLINRTIHRVRFRRMTAAEIATLDDHMAGEPIFITDTQETVVSDGTSFYYPDGTPY